MANKGPSSLTAASAFGGTEPFHLIQSGNSRKGTPAQMATYVKSTLDGDKGDIVVSASGATWMFDTGVVTAFAKTFLDDADQGTVKTTLGVGTGDSPQFTGINIGHASDTTVTRASAGDIAIEGNIVYRAGGTDTALADGGTGASLVDPNADRILFWDDSAGAVTWLSLDPGLEISGTTLRTARGTSFPGSPASGDRFLRTDRNIEYYYDGTQWLSTQMLALSLSVSTGQTGSGTPAVEANPFNGTTIYAVDAIFSKTLSGSGNWTINLQTEDAGVSATIATSGAFTNTTRDTAIVAINATVASTIDLFMMNVVENSGTATLFGSAAMTYRLVG